MTFTEFPIRWDFALLLTCTLCMQCYYFIDVPLAVWLYQHQEIMQTAIFKVITIAGESQWYIAIGLLLFLWYQNRLPHVATQGKLLMASVTISGIAALVIKTILGRARPKLFFSDGLYGFDFFHTEHAWISFPSGHTTTAFSVATVLAICYPRWRVIWFAGAALIALSRVILTQHYMSDVIAGSVLGAFFTLLLYERFFKATFLQFIATEQSNAE